MTSTAAKIHNYSTLLFLTNPDAVRAIRAVYEPVKEVRPGPLLERAENGVPIKAELFKTMNPDIKIGDFIVVPTGTRLKMTVCRVTEVDCAVELDTTETVEWVVSVVDRAAFEETKRKEDRIINRVKSAKANAAREQLRQELLADVDGINLGELQITHQKPGAAREPGQDTTGEV